MSELGTKERLLDVAERLFADHGFASTSLRDITSEADANLAAVNYHFGGKDALLEAVFDRRLGPVNQERLDLLDAFEAEAGDAPVAIERILWANLAPPFRKKQEWGEGGSRFMRLVARLNADPNHVLHESFLRQFDTVRKRFLRALERALPALDSDEVERRTHFVLGAMMHTFCWGHSVACLCPVEQPESDRVILSLVRFAAAGMRVPAAVRDDHLTFDTVVGVAR